VECITDMAWHRKWEMERIPYQRLRVFPWRPLPLLCGALPDRAREIVKRLPVIGPRLRRRFGYRAADLPTSAPEARAAAQTRGPRPERP
jgi:hypothetical protein